ncbi:MAG: redox-regulated ATPase YchF [Anaerolineae bacterium]|jgi:GTP-binding protein YchF|nr:redox-regulated ATPase YchF [Anaerolineae bacterium]
MSLQIGIVGLPNVGKSTLFNALTRAGAAVASYPFTTIEPNVGIVEVPDPRLHDVAAIVQPDEVKPTTIEFVDIAGLVAGAHKGEGLGNQFLGHIRNVDAVALVVRCFEDPDVAHVTAELDPLADAEVLDLELMLADLGTVERREEKARSAAKAQPKEHAAELELLARVREHLARGSLASLLPLTPKEAEMLVPLNLLTAKPRLYVANVGEDALPEGGPLAAHVIRRAEAEGAQAVVICAACEADLADWAPEEAAEYRAELGLEASGLERLITASYRLLDLVTFFTATGTNVVRAWTLRRGQTVYEAAGKIHTDMQRGFIRAEVVAHADLVRVGDFARAREHGLLRLEGRDYQVQDGDVVHIRFSPPR